MAQSQKVIGGIFRINFSCIPLFAGGLIFNVGKKLFLAKRMETLFSFIHILLRSHSFNAAV